MTTKNKVRKTKRKELQAKVEADARGSFQEFTPEQQDQIIAFELQRMITEMRTKIDNLQKVTGSQVSFKYCFPISEDDTRTVFIELSKEHSTLIKQTTKEESDV